MRTIRGFEETVLSVGIDIGTTTTQLVISSLTIVNIAPGACVPRMEITEKKILYKSQIYFTPLKEHNLIDPVTLLKIVEKEYQNAGVKSEEIGTGAVIITGEAAKKENARSITEALDLPFISSYSGPNLESVFASKVPVPTLFPKPNIGDRQHRRRRGTSNFGIFKKETV